MHIYDMAGVERDWAWLHATFGPEVRVDPRAFATEAGWEVTALRAKDGPCAIVVYTRNADGSPREGVRCARWWNDPALPVLPAPLATWHDRGVWGTTNVNGDLGFGMGGGDAYDPRTPPYPVSEVWAEGNSDRVHGLGWIVFTNHLHLDVELTWTEGGVTPPPPPGDDVAAAIDRLTAVLAAGLTVRLTLGS